MRNYDTERLEQNGIRYIRVSRDFKIDEACRGMRTCLAAAHLPNPPNTPPHHVTEPHEWLAYADEWQAIAISWASA